MAGLRVLGKTLIRVLLGETAVEKFKKVTIVTLPTLADVILREIGRVGIVQLREVPDPEYEQLKRAGLVKRIEIELREFWETLRDSCRDVLERARPYVRPEEVRVSLEDLEALSKEPAKAVEKLLPEIEFIKGKIEGVEARVASIDEEIARVNERANAEAQAIRGQIETINKLQLLSKAAEIPIRELRKYLAVGVVKAKAFKWIKPSLEAHLERIRGVSYEAIKLPPDVFLLFSGSEESKLRVRAILSILGEDLTPAVREVARMKELTKKEEELRFKLQAVEEERKEKLSKLAKKRARISRTLKEQLREWLRKRSKLLVKIKALDEIARIRTLEEIDQQVLRSKHFTIIQGWVLKSSISELEGVLAKIRGKVGNLLTICYEDPDPRKEAVPSIMDVRFRFLRPLQGLVRLRGGWPDPREINPTLICTAFYALLFGFMFGDVGQGIALMAIGAFLIKKARGFFQKAGYLLLPAGGGATLFGFLYGEVFLVHVMEPLLLSPLYQPGLLFRIALGIAVAEMCAGLVLAMINCYKMGEPTRMIGERGIGFILFLIGIYVFGLEFLRVGDIFAMMQHWSFGLIAGGVALAAIEPIVTTIVTKHGSLADAMGKSVAGLIVVFVEGLCNFFSFLRIAAFALAHACLGVACEALSHALGPAIGIVLMNLIAMTFKFIACSVHGLRLLYYEVMDKFYYGGGLPFQPFTLKLS